MDGRMLDGRELRVQMARYGRPSSPTRSSSGRRGGGGGGGSGGRRRSRSRSPMRRRSRSPRRRSYSRSRSPGSHSPERGNGFVWKIEMIIRRGSRLSVTNRLTFISERKTAHLRE